MYPWGILGIDETDNKKTIKKAYAKLIRQYRPDEEPEKFQEVNQAYKYALKLLAQDRQTLNLDQLLKHVASESASKEKMEVTSTIEPKDTEANFPEGRKYETEVNNEVDGPINQNLVTEAELPESNLPDSSVEHISDELIAETESKSKEPDENESDEKNQTTNPLGSVSTGDVNTTQKTVDELFEKTHQMVFNTIHEKLKKNNWDFLSEFHSIDDFEIKDQVSKKMFRQVTKYNFFQLKQNKILLLPPEVLVYFDEVFNWGGYWQEYERSIEPIYCEHMLGLIHPDPVNKTHKSIAGLFDRMFAFGIDASISLFFTMLVAGSFSLHSYSEIIWFFSFGMNQIVGQMSGLSQSIGQKAHDIHVYDHFLNRPSIKKILIRNTVFCMTLLSCYYIVFLPFGSVFQFILAIIMVSVNVCVRVFKKQRLHEWLSQTVLVK